MFRRTRAPTECFFCQSPVPKRANPRAFKCPSCLCWNRYDANGEIISDEPAMHNAALNAKSFARRASAQKDRLPNNLSTRPVFCHACQTNQHLLVNLLANFLPDPSDPSYASRLAQLPAYEKSLHERYPPVCADCAVNVEQRIEDANRMARTSALSGFLNDTKGKQRALRSRPDGPRGGGRRKGELRTLAWTVRGVLWVGTTLASAAGSAYVATGRTLFSAENAGASATMSLLPFIVFISLLWTFWDPTYLKLQRAYIQGRDVKLKGRSQYVRLQLAAWVLRLSAACVIALPYYHSAPPSWLSQVSRQPFALLMLLTELAIFVFSVQSLRIQRPPKVRLLDTSIAHSLSKSPSLSPRSPTPGYPTPIDDDALLAPLSLSGNPVLPPSPSSLPAAPAYNPIFGLPSLFSSSATTEDPPPSPPPAPTTLTINDDDAMIVESEEDENAMDWTPTTPAKPTTTNGVMRTLPGPPPRRPRPAEAEDDGRWMRPQRFFAPEQPTGLEGLLARTGLSDVAGPEDGANATARRAQSGGPTAGIRRRSGAWVYVLSALPVLGGMAWQFYRVRERLREVSDAGTRTVRATPPMSEAEW